MCVYIFVYIFSIRFFVTVFVIFTCNMYISCNVVRGRGGGRRGGGARAVTNVEITCGPTLLLFVAIKYA